MTDISRRYYERELGAGLGPSPSLKERFGYSEPLRRFIQRASFEPQANEIPNTMPSWLPGDDYMTNFKVGDPYVQIDDGYARLPGAGYEALHPELKGLSPEDYPDNQVPPSCSTRKTLAHAPAKKLSAPREEAPGRGSQLRLMIASRERRARRRMSVGSPPSGVAKGVFPILVNALVQTLFRPSGWGWEICISEVGKCISPTFSCDFSGVLAF
jgi:hypothetical protein